MKLPQGIDSKVRFILVAAKRAHQLIDGAKQAAEKLRLFVFRFSGGPMASRFGLMRRVSEGRWGP